MSRKEGCEVDCGVANYIMGSGIDSAKDSCEKTASFVQPTGICGKDGRYFWQTLVQNASLQLLQKFCEHKRMSTGVFFCKGQILQALLNQMGPFDTP